jgi:hypothetical protein
MTIRIGKKSKAPIGAIASIMAGGVTAATVMLTPLPLIEMAAAASGLPAVLPAAAAPLGETARLILAFAAGVSGMALTGSVSALASRIRHRDGAFRIGYDIGYEDEDEPVFLRSTDAPRRPLFAGSDLADIAPLAKPTPAAAPEDLRMPMTPEPLDESELELSAAMTIIDAPAPKPAPRAEPAPRRAPAPVFESSPVEDPAGIVASLRASPADHAALSITELVSRFENGMRQRRAQIAGAVSAKKIEEAQAEARAAWLEPARITPAPQPEPQRKTIDAEVDEALRAALGTLQRMTAKAA